MTEIKAIVGGIGLLVPANVIAWVTTFDLGAVASGITLLATTLIGVYAFGYGAVTKAKIDAQKAFDEANKGSLSEQLEQIKKRVNDANQKLHEERNTAAVRELRHQEEVARLTEQIELLLQTSKSQSEEIKRLHAEIERLNRRIERQTEVIATGSSANIPVALPRLPGDTAEHAIRPTERTAPKSKTKTPPEPRP